jgi:hypothetical protein
MDHHKQPMAGESPNCVGQDKYQPNRPVCHEPGDAELQGHEPNDAPEGDRAGSNQFPNLGVLAEELFGAVAVRLGTFGI